MRKNSIILVQKGKFDDIETNVVELDNEEQGQLESMDLIFGKLFEMPP